AIGVLAALIPATLYFRREPEEKVPIRFEMAAPGILDQSLSISPDGQRIAYTALTDNFRQSAIWIRRLGDVKAQAIPGTEGAAAAILWSPDNRSIAFYADGRLKKISINGGSPTVLAETPLISAVPGIATARSCFRRLRIESRLSFPASRTWVETLRP